VGYKSAISSKRILYISTDPAIEYEIEEPFESAGISYTKYRFDKSSNLANIVLNITGQGQLLHK